MNYLIGVIFSGIDAVQYVVDVVFQDTKTLDYFIDALIQQTDVIKTFIIDVLLSKEATAEYSVDLVMSLSTISNYNLDVLFKILDQMTPYELDVLFKKEDIKAYDLDMMFIKVIETVYSIDVAIRSTVQFNYMIDALLMQLYSLDWILDIAHIRKSKKGIPDWLNQFADLTQDPVWSKNIREMVITARLTDEQLENMMIDYRGKMFIITDGVDAFYTVIIQDVSAEWEDHVSHPWKTEISFLVFYRQRVDVTQGYKLDFRVGTQPWKVYLIDTIIAPKEFNNYSIDSVFKLLDSLKPYNIDLIINRQFEVPYNIDVSLVPKDYENYLIDLLIQGIATTSYNLDVCLSARLIGWTYREGHYIEPANGAGIGYQKLMVIHREAGTSAGADCYVGTDCRADFGDLRFTSEDGFTELPYWIEEYNATTAYIWVKISPDLDEVHQLIYVYYGKADAVTTSDPITTFEFFDHFDGVVLDATKWDNYGNGSLTVTGSELRLSHSNYQWKRVQSKVGFGTGYSMRMKFKTSNPNDYNRPDYLEWGDATTDEIPANYCGYYKNDYHNRFWRTPSQSVDKGSVNNDTAYHKLEVGRDTASTAKCFRDNTIEESYETGLTSGVTANEQRASLKVGYIGYAGSHIGYIDWILVRKFMYPSPQHGIWLGRETF